MATGFINNASSSPVDPDLVSNAVKLLEFGPLALASCEYGVSIAPRTCQARSLLAEPLLVRLDAKLGSTNFDSLNRRMSRPRDFGVMIN